MVCMQLKIGWHVIFDQPFHSIHIFARRKPCAVPNPENMRVYRLCRLPPPHVQHNIRRLAPNTGERLQSGAGIRNNTVIVIDQNLAHLDDVLGFLAEQANGFDVFGYTLKSEVQHFLRCIRNREQSACRLVHARICGLRRQGNRHDKRIYVDMLKLALGFSLGRLKASKYFPDRMIIKLFHHKNGMRNIRVARNAPSAYLRTMTQENTYHYAVMARAIEAIDAADETLSLADMAAQMQMSPAHFQRLFSQWVGVSPKRYQQYLTLGHAKTLLRDRFTTLETADSVGLSGSGRLHDLFLKWEAMSPGTYATGGAALTIKWGWFDSAFGPALVMGTDKGICGLAFAAESGAEAAMADLTSRWPNATFKEDPTTLHLWATAALNMEGDTRLHMIGAPFQLKVWEALLTIPSGHVTTYSEIAKSIGTPKAVRAVGTAVGRNPVSWLIPCHRALRKSGALGGYHWGLPVKRAMLAYESARVDASF